MTMQESLTVDEAIAGVTATTAHKIGVLADDHNSEDDASDLPAEVLTAFEGVDLILHLGHMGARAALERLGAVAPVIGVRDYMMKDGTKFVTPADGDRVAGLTRVVEAGGVRIGAVHNPENPPGAAIPSPPGGIVDPSGLALTDVLTEKFGGPVDVVAYGGSHRAAAVFAQGVMFVNPGSPAYPKGPGRVAGQRSLGTVGILEVNDGVVTFEVVELSTLS